MSSDLSRFVVEEAVANNCSYCVGLEGHDVSTMAFYFPQPINVVMIGRHQQFWEDKPFQGYNRTFNGSNSNSGDGRFTAQSPPVHDIAAESLQLGDVESIDQLSGGPLVLFGIFSTETPNSKIMRERILALFELHGDRRVCSFSDFRRLPVEERQSSPCRLIYAFVMGAFDQTNNDTLLPTQITRNDARPLEANMSDSNTTEHMIFLNIRENMNDGKSQTWLNYAAAVADEYGMEYVAKCDEDSILSLPKYFAFTADRLPRAPYNRGFYAGRVLNTAPYRVNRKQSLRPMNPFSVGSLPEFDGSFFDRHFNLVQFYMAGKQRHLPVAIFLFGS
jgi:hypothetical protein